jgi:hypothetical protein
MIGSRSTLSPGFASGLFSLTRLVLDCGRARRLEEYRFRRSRQICMTGVMGSRRTRRSMAVKEFLRSNWHAVTIAVTAGAIVCAAVFLLSTMPPRSIVMATGPEGGGYYEIGRQYQALLARTGVELRLVATAGTVENLPLCAIRTLA